MQENTSRAVRSSVIAVFDNGEQADQALAELRQMGAGPDDISVVMRDASGTTIEEPPPSSVPLLGGAATGAALGGMLGGLLGWMVAIGAIAIPGVGMVVGAGALAATIAGIGLGAATGGLIGALLSLGIPEDEAREYEEHVKQGRTLVTLHPSPGLDPENAQRVFESHGAYDVRIYEPPVETGAGDEEEQPALAAAEPVPESRLRWVEEPGTAPERAPVEPRPADIASEEERVGEISSQTDALGSRAEGGYGDGEALATTEPPNAGSPESSRDAAPRSSGEQPAQQPAQAEPLGQVASATQAEGSGPVPAPAADESQSAEPSSTVQDNTGPDTGSPGTRGSEV